MSIALQIQRLRQARKDIAASIAAKGVPVSPGARLDEYPALIDAIHQEEESADVLFYDYEGSLMHFFSRDRFLALESLPVNPFHEGLVAQGWNYGLEEAKAYVSRYGFLAIGQNYDTEDGATVVEAATDDAGAVTLIMTQSDSEGLSVDWGDGSAADTATGTGTVQFSHTYAAVGDVHITIGLLKGTGGIGGSDRGFLGSANNNRYLYALRIGAGITQIYPYSLQNSHFLESITVPKSLAAVGRQALRASYRLGGFILPPGAALVHPGALFSECNKLRCLSLGFGCTCTGSVAELGGCYSVEMLTLPEGWGPYGIYARNAFQLRALVLPEGVTNVLTNGFTPDISLRDVYLPSTLTSIGASAFSGAPLSGRFALPMTLAANIEPSAFNTSQMEALHIPEGITRMPASLCRYSRLLLSVIIPSTVTLMEENCLADCNQLDTMIVKASTPPTLYNGAVPSNASLTIYVPAVSVEAYKSATNWSAYADKIQAMEE